jgi:hypothetical protein
MNIKRFRLSEFLGFLCAVFFLLSKVTVSVISFLLFAVSTTMLPIVLIFIRIKGLLPTLIIRILLPLLYLNYVGADIVSYGLDIPNVIRSSYECVEGQPQKLQVGNKNKSQSFTINNIDFKFENVIVRIDTRKIYKITYLPNSKYVINIEEVKSSWNK